MRETRPDPFGLEEICARDNHFHFEPEGAHTAEAIEWWFFQGEYESGDPASTHFMVALFRFNVRNDRDNPKNGFQLLIATLDADGQHRSTTWIDRTLLRSAIVRLQSGEPLFDPAVQRAMVEEISQFGPAAPIICKASPRKFEARPFAVIWDNFVLRQDDGLFHICFPDPQTGEDIDLTLCPTAARMKVACRPDEIPLGNSMAYRTYPRVRVTGRSEAGANLVGRAWVDHQWGDTSWFEHHETGTLLGWDWFGITLDDGSDWLVTVHRGIRSGEPVCGHVSTRDRHGNWRRSHDITLTPTRHWVSPRTRTRHPVAWTIELPKLNARFKFEPLADDQEVFTSNGARSVWEGVGTITGAIGNRAVTGQARGEFHGYGYIIDIQDYLDRMAEGVDSRLEQFFPREFDIFDVERFVGPARGQHEPHAYTAAISAPVWDLIDRSGKRWRPLFGILLLETMGVAAAPYEELICAMTELIHAGSLIVDDIEDQSEIRRGGPAIHHRYGTDIALNAGNCMYFLPIVSLVNHPLLSPEKRLAIHEIKERVCVEAHFGQATDIYWSRNLSSKELKRRLTEGIEDQLLQMYAFKTASAPSGVAEVAAVVAGADEETRRRAAEFGRAVGVAYQIIDDIHNFSRDPGWSKTCGEDLAGGKLTFVIVHALQQLPPGKRERLAQVLCDPVLRADPETLDEGIDLVRASGALAACRERAQAMLHMAWTEFTAVMPPTEAKIMLHAMCLKLVELAYDG